MSGGPATVVFVSEASHSPPEDRFAELAAAAWSLTPPAPHERADVLRSEAGFLVDRLLTRSARGRAALDIAIGEGLLALGDGHRTMRFGHAGIGDYARERLGIKASTAVKMARRAQKLRSCLLLRNAVWLGVVSISKADAILPVARGDDQESWVARARCETVNALEKAVRRLGAAEPEEEEKWERVFVQLFPDAKLVWDKALELAGRVLGLTTPKWQRGEAVCQEYVGSHPPPDDRIGKQVLYAPVTSWLQELKDDLEKANQQWEFLDRADPVVAPVPSVPVMEDALLLDAELRRLAALRGQWDELFGHLATLLKMMGLWRDAGFASFGHYCSERLGISVRAVEQRIALERRLYALPKLRQAMRNGRVSYEKARLIAWQANDETVEQWVERASGTTCIALRREIEAGEDAQISARGDVDLRMPERVRRVFEDAIRAARRAAGKWITPSECLRRIAEHFIAVWEVALKERSTVQKRVLKRDKGFCQVPACSRAAAHVHHIIRRSQGGTDDPSNLVSLCAAHHLHGVHDGWIRVSGKAPDQLRWELTSSPAAAGWSNAGDVDRIRNAA